MARITEYNYLLVLGLHGIETCIDGDAINNRITEWFATPMGTVADNPRWGHPLQPIKFEPHSKDIEAIIEMAIVEKLPDDVEDVRIQEVRVEFAGIDCLNITIVHNAGNLHQQFALRETGDVRVAQ